MYLRNLTNDELLRYAEGAGCETELEKELVRRLEIARTDIHEDFEWEIRNLQDEIVRLENTIAMS